jgi:hypothetical protein
VNDLLKEIKQSFRLYMDGARAQSLREKGVQYHLNWGVSLGHLQEMSRDYEPSHDLAAALWQENVRECKILATMLMPIDAMPEEEARQWIADTPTQEVAEIGSMALYSRLPYAKELALSLVDKEEAIEQLHGWCILVRLLSQGMTLAADEQQHVKAKAAEVMKSGNPGLMRQASRVVAE